MVTHAALPALRPPRHSVDPRARRWWTVQALFALSGPMLLTGVFLLVAALLWFPGALVWLAPLTVLVLIAPAVAYLVVMPRVRYRVHAWELGDTAVYAAGGWWWRTRRIAPLHRVQTVDTVRGPLQQWFGLATITVTTASTAGDVRIAGLARADAEDLAHRIGAAAALATGDAT